MAEGEWKVNTVAVLATRRLYTVGKTTVEATMFGNKQAKRERLEQMADVIEQHPEGISQSELARQVGAPRSTVKRDLPALEQAGILLSEDERGWLALFGRRK
jgi:DNA-binding transcriptional ArsR family regulator